jgi:hypothetical protein
MARVPQRLWFWFAGLPEPARDLIEPFVYSPTFLAFLFAWHPDISNVHARSVTPQDSEFIHRDAERRN